MSAADPRVQLKDVSQRYGSVTALDAVSLDVADGEFLTLLGPSGCGKTTLLRVIAGFIRPSAGSVLLGGLDVIGVPPNRRPVNMVFQRPTLFPHLDVAGNVAFGLRIAGVPRSEQRARVDEALALVRLEGYQARRAHELSGGQMQRVALARALVNRPQVLLLDEPLSALDLKIRLEMEVELRRLHRETGATFVYVTHDQREALALSDRVAVFDQGAIEQIGSPDEIYRRPVSPFAARFVGDANVLAAEISTGGDVTIAGRAVAAARADAAPGSTAWLVVRPEAVTVTSRGGDPQPGLHGTVVDLAFRGSGFSYRIEIDGLPEPLKAETPLSSGAISIGTSVAVSWDATGAILLRR